MREMPTNTGGGLGGSTVVAVVGWSVGVGEHWPAEGAGVEEEEDDEGGADPVFDL